jgi:hypothetical protein
MKVVGNIASDSEVVATANGAITAGKPVIVNADGTVGVVTETSVSAGFGTEVTFESANVAQINATYDTSNNKVVVAYQDSDNSDYGTAVVGTVSGTDISFGTPVVFSSASTPNLKCTFDSNANKVAINYQNSSGNGAGIVGTVSGTSISFGSSTVYASINEANTKSACFDSNANKVIFTYEDRPNSRTPKAVVGTISGTSISFGSPVTIESGNNNAIDGPYAQFDSSENSLLFLYGYYSPGVGYAKAGQVDGTSITLGSRVTFYSTTTPSNMAMAYDSVNSKMVCTFTGNSNYGYAIIATISGTSVSFGTEVVFESANTDFARPVYDIASGKINISYNDNGNSSYGTLIIGTVSGTSISFDTATVYSSVTTSAPDAVYDPDSTHTVLVYEEQSGSNSGVSRLYFNSFLDPNLTSENFIGFAKDAVADGAVATLHTANSISRNQSSLTAGQTYFVQTDGTLSTTADSPSVTAGTAISATELIVKG